MIKIIEYINIYVNFLLVFGYYKMFYICDGDLLFLGILKYLLNFFYSFFFILGVW